jgi:hypothetical protein
LNAAFALRHRRFEQLHEFVVRSAVQGLKYQRPSPRGAGNGVRHTPRVLHPREQPANVRGRGQDDLDVRGVERFAEGLAHLLREPLHELEKSDGRAVAGLLLHAHEVIEQPFVLGKFAPYRIGLLVEALAFIDTNPKFSAPSGRPLSSSDLHGVTALGQQIALYLQRTGHGHLG